MHVTDGKGLYYGMKVYVATSEQDAIDQAKSDTKNVPLCCTQWFASTEKKYINSIKRMYRSKGKTQC